MTEEDLRDTLDTAGIAELVGCSRAHATDRLTKQRGFPKPVVSLSQKTRRWARQDVIDYLTQPRSGRARRR